MIVHISYLIKYLNDSCWVTSFEVQWKGGDLGLHSLFSHYLLTSQTSAESNKSCFLSLFAEILTNASNYVLIAEPQQSQTREGWWTLGPREGCPYSIMLNTLWPPHQAIFILEPSEKQEWAGFIAKCKTRPLCISSCVRPLLHNDIIPWLPPITKFYHTGCVVF